MPATPPILKFSLEDTGPTSAEDIDRERAVVARLLDAVDSQREGEELRQDLFDASTPWIASQLGKAAELAASQGGLVRGLSIAHAAIRAAESCADPRRLNANWLTKAGILLELGRLGEAEKAYRRILSLPFEQGQTERSAAHISLASIAKETGRHLDAVHHYQIASRILRGLVPEQTMDTILAGHVASFQQARDVIGVLHAGSRQKKDVRPAVTALVPKMSLDQAMIAWTRFSRLQEPELAELVLSCWKATSTHHE